MELTRDELLFLESQGYSIEDVLDKRLPDGRLMSKNECKLAAASQGKLLVLGSPCKRAQHRLRTRAGHCAQCDTSKLAYQNRDTEPGRVYIAGSKRKNIIKIGFTKSIDSRIDSLEGYAGAYDWLMLASKQVSAGGAKEREIGSLLVEYRTEEWYMKSDQSQRAIEIYTCPLSVALKAFRYVVGEPDRALPELWPIYEFSNQKNS